ncbi:hypothetical protein HXK74_03135 [Candidatus Gracilibacteria bacterium]|nr:hypothetical protein [Candidatus Gracilibacteria bacterium]
MKKQILFAGFASLLLLNGCINTPEQTTDATEISQTGSQITSGTLTFKAEYEALNDNDHPHLTVPESLNIETLDFSGTQSLLTSGNGVLYLGFPTCPWCRVLLPELFTAMKQSGINQLYYFNPKEIRDQKELVEGKIVVKKESTPEYDRLLNKLDEILPEYKGLNNPKIKRLYVPTVLVIKDGKVVNHHFETLPEQTDPHTPLTSDQKIKLQVILQDAMSPLTNTSCAIPAEGETPKYSC